ncbi:hypothetical protein ACFQ46_23525 [Kineococcus sp. GCM10028916]|uniref:hypothetical protein n=1 Tax=Kineococcus sp. GCM10028916 TaxID=3273394 RepID=UPI0036425E8B
MIVRRGAGRTGNSGPWSSEWTRTTFADEQGVVDLNLTSRVQLAKRVAVAVAARGEGNLGFRSSAGARIPGRRRLLAVLSLDTASVAGLVLVALGTRSRPSGAGYGALARTAVASLAPAVVAVAHERLAHRSGAVGRHSARGTVLLLVAGSSVSTAGAARVLSGCNSRRGDRRRLRAVSVSLLIGGNVVLVPYLAALRALHGREGGEDGVRATSPGGGEPTGFG